MPDVFPRRNLPDLAEQWGRDVEGRVVNLDTSITIIGQEVQSLNRNTASSLSVVANQIVQLQEAQAAIELTQAQIIAAQADITAAQASITATTNFLSTQTLYDQCIGVSGGSKSGVSGIVYEGFNSTYDCSISVTTASSGKLLISAGAAVTSSGAGAGVGPEIVGVTLPDFTDSAAAGEGGVVGASRSRLFSLSANTTYTVRTRRWYTGSSAQFVSYQDASLVVTRLA